jgi:hypothetical protein
LFGLVTVGGRNEVRSAYGPGAKAERAENWFRADAAADMALADSLVPHEFSNNFSEVGGWHTHPTGYGEGRPSPGDLQSWAGLRQMFANKRRFVPRYIGVIVCPNSSRGWQEPDLHAWIVRRGQHDFSPVICERAVIR